MPVALRQAGAPSLATVTRGLALRHDIDLHGGHAVQPGQLRPTVFGTVDGLVTNAPLIAGIGGGGAALPSTG